MTIREQLLHQLPILIVRKLIATRKLTNFLNYITNYFQPIVENCKEHEELCFVINSKDEIIRLFFDWKATEEGEEFWKELRKYIYLKKDNVFDPKEAIQLSQNDEDCERRIFIIAYNYRGSINKNSKVHEILANSISYTELELAIALSRTEIYKLVPEVFQETDLIIKNFKK